MEELQTIVFRFAELKRYDVVQHALSEIQQLLSQYLLVRDRALRVPGSSMGLFFPSEIRFDAVLTRQLERLKAQAAHGIERSDQELIKQVVNVLAELGNVSLSVQSYFAEHGENPVTAFIGAYLWGVIQDSAVRRLDDVPLEGADRLRDLCTNLIDHQFFISALGQAERLEQLGIIAVANLKDVVLHAAVGGLSDCLSHSALRTYPDAHVTRDVMERLVRITKMRLASPLALDMTAVSYSVGPFISPTERSSLVGVNVQLANGIAQLSGAGNIANWDVLRRLRYSYAGIHDRLWLDLAEIAVESIKKNSFLTHFVNSSLEEIVRINVWLLEQTRLPRIDPITDEETAREQYSRDSFKQSVRGFVLREITGVYSRVISAMLEHKQLNYLDETIEQQCIFAFWCTDIGMTEVATDACDRIFKVCIGLLDQEGLIDPYRSARTATHIAEIGIYALAKNAAELLTLAKERYREVRQIFKQRYPDLRFVGDFESAERELIERRRGPVFNNHDRAFSSGVTNGEIREFFRLMR